jgi:hypothetical protein
MDFEIPKTPTLAAHAKLLVSWSERMRGFSPTIDLRQLSPNSRDEEPFILVQHALGIPPVCLGECPSPQPVPNDNQTRKTPIRAIASSPRSPWINRSRGRPNSRITSRHLEPAFII